MTIDAVPAHDAIYFNGRSSRKHYVTLRFADGVELVEQDAVSAVWPYADIRRVDGADGVLRLRCISALPLARVEVRDAAAQNEIAARCASLNDGRGPLQTGRIVGWSLAAICSIVMMVVFVVPLVADRLTPFIPRSFENRIGGTVDKQVRSMFGGRECRNPAGQAALTRLVGALSRAGGIDFPLHPAVLPSAIPNAFALPGGRIYVLDGILQKAETPDEIAGILAHELGHVKHRDTMRRMIQTGGTSLLVGLLFGDVTGAGAVIFAGRSMLDASYSRDAEHNADVFAIDVMHKLGRSPLPMGNLLFRITGSQGSRSYTILASHPVTEARLAEMRKEDRPATGAELLTAEQWHALKNICLDAALRTVPQRVSPVPQSSGGGDETR